jgi:hypothetical protein
MYTKLDIVNKKQKLRKICFNTTKSLRYVVKELRNKNWTKNVKYFI